MISLLKISVGLLYIIIGCLIILYPVETQEFISDKYLDFKEVFTIFLFPEILSSQLISNLPLWSMYALGVFVFLGSIVIFIGYSTGILFYAGIMVFFGIVLNVPTHASMIRMFRRFGTTFIIFSCMVVLFVKCDEEETYQRRKARSLKLKEKKDQQVTSTDDKKNNKETKKEKKQIKKE